MSELEVTWMRAAQIWWAMMWRTVLLLMVPFFLIGMVAGMVLLVNKIPVEAHLGKMQVISFFAGIPVGIWLIKHVLSAVKFRGFRIALVAAHDAGPDSQGNQRASADFQPG